ncbi:unnamed protein product [Aspergillus oryzae]|nr:unnamed protein product [Aspergillus oryzae]GMF94501.1 unnamed protein product [Aspergillus oryzae]
MHSTKVTYPEPMQLSGILDQYESFQVTPCIGTEFPKANLAEWLSSPNADALLRDLAITIVFFRAQTDLDGELQKELTHRLGVQSGKPAGHRLSKHPLHLIRKDDPEMGVLDPGRQQKLHGVENTQKRQRAVLEYHSDGSYEVCPPDFTMLRMTEIPPTARSSLSSATTTTSKSASAGTTPAMLVSTTSKSKPCLTPCLTSIAIWDNRCVLHCPTQDHYGLGGRMGYRTMGIAEKPYLDPNSPSRQEALAAAAK